MTSKFIFQFLQCNKISLLLVMSSFILVKILITWMFTAMALSLFKIHESMVTPCSVKQNGAYRNPCISDLEDANCVSKFSNSSLFHFKHEIFGETADISPNGFLESFGFHSLQFREIPVNHYLFRSNHIYFIHNNFIGRQHNLFDLFHIY